MQTLKRVFRPRTGTLLLCALFIAIALGGKLQAWVFTDEIAPKPALYHLLEPLPLWLTWMYLLMPLGLLTAPLRWLGLDPLHGPAWLFWLVNSVYFYVLASLIVAGFRTVRGRGVP